MKLDGRIASRAGRASLRPGPGALAMGVALLLCAVVVAFGGKDARDIAGSLGVFLGSSVAGVLFVRRARAFTGRERLGWTLVGAGLLCAALGVLVVATLFVAGYNPPAFGWPDLFFVATYLIMIAAFGVLPHTQGSPFQRWRMLIDGLIGAVSVGALLWVYVISDLTHDLEGAAVSSRVIGIAYPFLDLTVVSMAMIVLLRRSAFRFDLSLGLFAIGVGAQVAGDIAFFASAGAGSFGEAEPFYMINLLAMAAFFSSAYVLAPATSGREYAERNPPLWIVVAPYIPAFGMLVVFVVDTYAEGWGQPNGVLLAGVILVGLLVIARQTLAIVENRTIVEQQRDALVSTISHELRTPLTAIVGFTNLLDDEEAPMSEAERDDMLAIVRDQADYMSRIVSDLIMLARGDDDLDLDVARIPLQDLVLASIQASGIPASTVTIECRDDLEGFVDPDRIQQVIVNFLTNAARYGGPNRLVRVVKDGADLILEVHDDGPGVPRRFEVRIWDRFERGPNRLNATIPGSGIGLAVVEAIALKHGGSASLRPSEELGGACFIVDLPGRAVSGRGRSTSFEKGRIQNPEPRTQNPEPRTQNPEPRTQNPESRIRS